MPRGGTGCLGSSMVEQLTLNQLVLGSSPSRGTTSSPTSASKVATDDMIFESRK
jgi:hypothetical protein